MKSEMKMNENEWKKKHKFIIESTVTSKCIQIKMIASVDSCTSEKEFEKQKYTWKLDNTKAINWNETEKSYWIERKSREKKKRNKESKKNTAEN